MERIDSYRKSHIDKEKGIKYDKEYCQNSWNSYLWSQEKKCLIDIIKKFCKDENTNYLDFACGTGRIVSFIEGYVANSTAVDVSSSMLEEALKKVKKTEIINVDLTTENVLDDRKFDLITAFRFFLNAENDLRNEALKVLSCLLDEQGYLIINSHQNRTNFFVFFKIIIRRFFNKGVNFNTMSFRETKSLLRDHDFEIVKIYSVGLLSTPKIKLSKSLNSKIDTFCSKFWFLSKFSESPILVCRKIKRQ